MACAPSKYDQMLEELRAVMKSWDEEGTQGELVLVRGQNQWQPELRPRIKLDALKHETGGKAIIKT